MKIAIIQYNAGNIQSVVYALNRLGIEPVVSDDIDTLQSADKIIFPGVGEAGSAMEYLKEKGLHKLIPSLKQPVLGICLGMQLLCSFSEENNTACLGVFDAEVKKISAQNLKVPQIGWNTIAPTKNPLFKNIDNPSYVYFVHSFYVPLNDYTIAKTSYGDEYSSAIAKGNFFGVQFHPEKSAAAGDQILKNFIKL